jgi:hypothetical protein
VSHLRPARLDNAAQHRTRIGLQWRQRRASPKHEKTVAGKRFMLCRGSRDVNFGQPLQWQDPSSHTWWRFVLKGTYARLNIGNPKY